MRHDAIRLTAGIRSRSTFSCLPVTIQSENESEGRVCVRVVQSPTIIIGLGESKSVSWVHPGRRGPLRGWTGRRVICAAVRAAAIVETAQLQHLLID